MNQEASIILASQSPRRNQLMKRSGLKFRCIASNAIECSPGHLTPIEVAKTNAHRKARTISTENPDALVIGADTVVALGKKLYGKPEDLKEAFNFLRQLAGQTHEVTTGVCLTRSKPERVRLFSVTTRVTLQPLRDQVIKEYLSMINPLDKAGGYAIQEHGDWIIGEIYGSYTNVVGLPMERIQIELNAWFAI